MGKSYCVLISIDPRIEYYIRQIFDIYLIFFSIILYLVSYYYFVIFLILILVSII